MLRFIAAALEMLALWLYRSPPLEERWSVVWSHAGPDLASRDMGDRPTLDEAKALWYDKAAAMCDEYGGSVYLMSPEGEALAAYSASEQRPPSPCWLARMGARSPN